MTAQTALRLIRESDLIARVGGEEFAIIMPQTAIGGAMSAAEKIRAAIEKNNHPTTGIQTTSIGVAERMKAESFRHWYRRVDAALYRAKQSGRNRVMASNERDNSTDSFVRLNWRKEWECGDAEIDQQHQEIIVIANQLMNRSFANQGQAEVMGHLQILLDHIALHFIYEEKLLAAIHYPDQSIHVDIHKSLITKALRLKESYTCGEIRPSAFFSFVMDDVILGHLMEVDTKFFPYIGKMGKVT